MHTRSLPFLFTSALLVVSLFATTAYPLIAYADDSYVPPPRVGSFIDDNGVKVDYTNDYYDESNVHLGYTTNADGESRVITIPPPQAENPYDPASIKGMLWKNLRLGGSASERTIGILSNVLQQAEDAYPNDTIYTPDVFDRTYKQQLNQFGAWSGNEDPSDQLFKIAAQTPTNFDEDFFRQWQASPVGIQWNQEGQQLWQASQVSDDDSLLNAVLIIVAIIAIVYLGPAIFSTIGEASAAEAISAIEALEASAFVEVPVGAIGAEAAGTAVGFEAGAGFEVGTGFATPIPTGIPASADFTASFTNFGADQVTNNFVTWNAQNQITGEIVYGTTFETGAIGESLENWVVQYYIDGILPGVGSTGAALSAVALGVDQAPPTSGGPTCANGQITDPAICGTNPGGTVPGDGNPGGTPGDGNPGGTPGDGNPGGTPGDGNPGGTPGGGNPGGTPGDGNPGGGTPAAPIITTNWQVAPLMVRSGEPTYVSWDVPGASSCTISSTNNDKSFGTGNKGTKERSDAIYSQTIFSLTCDGVFRGSKTVNIIPTFQEI